MKKILVIALFLLVGCATGIGKDAYMERARVFDKSQYGNEYTDHYQGCYLGFMYYLIQTCRPMVPEDGAGSNHPYWQCAADALTEMEECLNEL